MSMTTYTIEGLVDQIEKTGRSYNIPLIRSAYETAAQLHEGQKRSSGEPYIIHPVAVASILVELGMDSESVAAALLHDVVEDTGVTLPELEKKFGKSIAQIVNGVTKLTQLPTSTKAELQAENIRKMLLAMSEDIRVIIVKLADRLHNMRTIEYRAPQKRRDKSLETMEVYAPIAHRLGIRAIKEELEDLSLRQLDTVGYQEIERHLNSQKETREKFLEKIKEKITGRLKVEHPHFTIEGRVKSIYGIYKKMYMQGKLFEEIYDIYAVRIIVDSVIDCYNILGVIHDLFQPLPNRFKDYISTPKPNMYQSLHTTVIDKEGIPFEVQIRTWDMHYTAEYGIAAHWKYKAGISGKDKLDEKLTWIRTVLENQQESDDAEDILRTIKSDLAPDEVFVFTPKGDVKSLPAGATVIDFAYAIHTAVGNKTVGAKVDGRIVPLDYEVKTGEIVEILTSNAQGKGPSRDWLNLAHTSEARNKIRGWFKKERREENIQEGQEQIEKEFRRNGISLTDEQYQQFLEEIARRQHQSNVEEFYAALGYGGLSLSKIMPRIKEEYQRTYRSEPPKMAQLPLVDNRKNLSGVVVEHLDNCLVKFAKCCNPLPGDEIIGYVTRGYGVSIHKRDCINVHADSPDREEAARWVRAWWGDQVKEQFKTTLEIIATDRYGFLADLTMFFTNLRVQMNQLNARELKNRNSAVTVTFSTSGLEQVKSIMAGISKLAGVISVERANQ